MMEKKPPVHLPLLLLCASFCILAVSALNQKHLQQRQRVEIDDDPASLRDQGQVIQLGEPLNWGTMEKYLMYAFSSFCHVGLKNWTCYWCKKVPTVPHLNVTYVIQSNGLLGIYGYVGYSSTTIITAFRGTSSYENIITDAKFWQSAYHGVPDAKVHYGFYEGWLSVKNNVISQVKAIQAKTGIKHVVSTGHSLGAALSTLCAADMAREGIKGVELWNFGQPRVGNQGFSKYFSTLVPTVYRVVHRHDLVPHIPPTWLGYHHEPTEVWFRTNGTSYIVCSKTNGEDPKCSYSLPVWDYDRADHLRYLGFHIGDGSSHGCGGFTEEFDRLNLDLQYITI